MEPNSTPQTSSLPSLGSGIRALGSGAIVVAPKIPDVADLPRSPKRRFNFQIVAAVVAVVVLLVGGIAGFLLTQESQDLRQQASGVSCEAVYFGSGEPSSQCVGKLTGSKFVYQGYEYTCEFGNVEAGKNTCVAAKDLSKIFCAACNAWFPMSAGYTCTAIEQNGCKLPTGTGGGMEENEGSEGENGAVDCGGNGEKCCDPKNSPVCNASLYCNTDNGKCQAEIPGGICGGNQGSGGQLDPNKCIVCDCGSQCNRSGECTLNCKADQDCNAATQALLSGNTCGQVDFQDTNKAYCGVKAIKCDGSCAGGGGGGSGVQCKEIIGRVGEPASGNPQIVAPRIGDQFFLKCRNVAGATSYRFRYFYTRKNNLSILSTLKGIRVPARDDRRSVSQFIPIEQVGFYYGQCRVCMPDASVASGQKCSPWESTQNNGKRLPFQEGGPFGGQADGTDGSIPTFSSTIDGDDGLPEGTLPVFQPIPEYQGARATPVPTP